jgi:hypothetical protein
LRDGEFDLGWHFDRLLNRLGNPFEKGNKLRSERVTIRRERDFQDGWVGSSGQALHKDLVGKETVMLAIELEIKKRDRTSTRCCLDHQPPKERIGGCSWIYGSDVGSRGGSHADGESACW